MHFVKGTGMPVVKMQGIRPKLGRNLDIAFTTMKLPVS